MSWPIFFFFVALVVTALLFVDWMLGEKKRENIKDSILSYWHFIETSSWAGLLRADAKAIYIFISNVIGRRNARLLHRNGRIFFQSVFAIIAFLLAYDFFDLDVFVINNIGSTINLSFQALLIVIASAAVIVFSLAFSIGLIRLMALTVRLPALLTIMLLDLLVAMSLIFLFDMMIDQWNGLFEKHEMHKFANDVVGFWRSGIAGEIEPQVYNIDAEARILNVIENTFLVMVVFGFFVFLPTLLIFGVASAFLLSKLVPAAIKPVTLIVLARVYEDKRPVFSLLAIAIAAIAGLIKAAVEAFGS